MLIIDSFAKIFFLAFILSIFRGIKNKLTIAISIENQKFDIETNYLNSKIDNHFFLNSINIFYSHFVINKPVTANKLIRLSDFVKKNL